MLNITRLLMAIVIICSSFSAFAEERVDPIRLFTKGMEAFQRSDYTTADTLFNDAIKHGLQEPELSVALDKKDTILTCNPTKGPATRTWIAFEAALEKADFQAAYKLLSSGDKRKFSFEKFKHEASRLKPKQKTISDSEQLKPGREEKVDKKTILLHFCQDKSPKGKPLKMVLEAGSWRFANE